MENSVKPTLGRKSLPVPLHPSEPARTHQEERIRYWDAFATKSRKEGLRRYYRSRLMEIFRFVVAPGASVLELGCGKGDLLAALEPARGLGIDFSGEMIRQARERHPHLEFMQADVHEIESHEKFDYIILSDLVNELWDAQRLFEVVARMSHGETRILINSYSRLWEGPRRVAEMVGLAERQLTQNWFTVEDITNLLYLVDLEVIRGSCEILWPVSTPGLSGLANRYLVKLPFFRWFGITNFVIARPRPRARQDVSVSVIVPARNEAGNIAAIFDRLPDMGAGTELIFVEGHSKDDTWERIQTEIAKRNRPRTVALRQEGTGKGDAVRRGFAHATGQLLMILDADLTVPPEDLPRFYDAWRLGKGDFINGVRLIYPMQEGAMRFFNLVANKFFGLAFSWLLGQSVKDTLCGTKVLSREHYELIAARRSYFGDFDPFGDFDLLFGAARFNLKIVDLPIRYRERVYGETNIQRWRHGLLLFRMMLFCLRRIKFV